MLKRGDFVELDGRLAVVVGLPGDLEVPEDHVALWFGTPQCKRSSEGGPGGATPDVWTVPAEYCETASPPKIHH